jgi:hypothetical protein
MMKQFATCLFLISIALLTNCSETKDEPDVVVPEIEASEYSISGTILGVEKADISISNGINSVQTDAYGHYQFDHLKAGLYTITPSKVDLKFIPISTTVQIATQDLSNIDFESLSENDLFFKEHVWTPFNEDVYDVVSLDENELQMALTANAIWYQNGQAGLIYQMIEGDFTLSSLVTANKYSNGQDWDCNVCLGGLMARNPDNTGGENYVHIVAGYTPVGIGVETKSTTKGVSEYSPTNDGSNTYYLQIKRVGSTFTMSKKAVGAENWVVASTYQRADLPNKLQVGMNIYTSLTGTVVADLSVVFKELTLE